MSPFLDRNLGRPLSNLHIDILQNCRNPLSFRGVYYESLYTVYSL
nr:MAG TPA: hypothetical protein [Caudoviricetes sp.]